MKIDVLLIQSVVMKGWKTILRYSYTFPSLGLLYVAAILQNHGIRTAVVDFQVEHYTREKFKRMLLEWRPAIIGISSYTESYSQTREVATFSKVVLPNVRTVLGGTLATFEHESILRQELAVDYVVRHEGEKTMLELTEIILNHRTDMAMRDIRGIAFREGPNIITCEKREPGPHPEI